MNIPPIKKVKYQHKIESGFRAAMPGEGDSADNKNLPAVGRDG